MNNNEIIEDLNAIITSYYVQIPDCVNTSNSKHIAALTHIKNNIAFFSDVVSHYVLPDNVLHAIIKNVEYHVEQFIITSIRYPRLADELIKWYQELVETVLYYAIELEAYETAENIKKFKQLYENIWV